MDEQSKEQLESLIRENDDLKDLNSRLNCALRRFQMTTPKDLLNSSEVPMDDMIPPWAANAVFLSPLLMAYDNRIQELEQSLDRARQNAEECIESSKRLTAENTALRNEMDRKWREMIEKEKKSMDGGNLALSFHTLEKNELQQRADLLEQENTVLLEQLDLFKKRNEYIEALAKDRDETAEKLMYQNKQMNTEFRNLQVIEEDIRAQKEIAENKLKITSERLGTLEREREKLVTDVNKVQNELRIAQHQAQYFKKAYEEMEAKKNEEIGTLAKDAHNLSIREKEVVGKSMMQEKELEEAKEQAFYYKQEFESLRSECDTMLKIMEDYEQKIANYQQKEESVHVLVRESRQKVEEALLERDRAGIKEQQYVKTIERLQESLKFELAEQKSKFESLINSLKEKNKLTVSRRDEEVLEVQKKLHVLQVSYEKALREASVLQKDLGNAEELLEEEQKRATFRLNDYEKRFRDAEEARLNEKRALSLQSSSIYLEREEWDRARKNFETLLTSAERENDSLQASIKRIKDEYKKMEIQLEDFQRERENLIHEINEVKEEMYYKVEEVKDSCGYKTAALEKQLQEAGERQRESEEKAFELFRQQEKVSEKWKAEHLNTVGYFEKVIQDQNYEIRRLAKRNKDLGDSFPTREIMV